jgi:sugar/nucleoside kinase (ribokinase family)
VPGPLVLACGLTTLDVRQTVDRVPGPDEKVVARDLAVEVGGPAANAATTCTALGVPARLLTRVGGAAVGRIASADLTRHGVEVHDLAGPDDAPAVSTVLVTAGTGQRAVASVNATLASTGGAVTGSAAVPAAVPSADGATASDRRVDDALGDLLGRVLDGASAVLVDGHHLDLAVPVAAAARARGVVVVLDGGSWKPGLETLLAHVDLAVLSADFRLPDDVAPRHRDDVAPRHRADAAPPGEDAAPAGGDAAQPGEGAARPGEGAAQPRKDAGPADLLARVGDLGPSVVAQSHGGDPVQVRHPGGHAQVPVPPVRAVDTLGAGDVLHGALAAWLACAAARVPSPAAGDDPNGTDAIRGDATHADLTHADPTHHDATGADRRTSAARAGDVLEALAFATAVASSSVMAPGARGWTADPDTVDRLRAALSPGS